MQPGNTPPTWQSNQPQLQNQQYPPPPIPGQFQYPSPPPYNVPTKRTPGFRNWFRTRSHKTKLRFGLVIVALLLCIFAVYAFGSPIVATKVTPTPTTSGNHGSRVSPGASNSPTLQPTLNTGTAILGAQL